MYPKRGDRIMIFKETWAKLILSKTKQMEVRSRCFEEGLYWIGCNKKIIGRFRLGQGKHIQTIEKWKDLLSKHRCETDELPYKKTWCFHVTEVKAITPVEFKHPMGAISIVIYRE